MSRAKYGIPYRGSKNEIAENIIEYLPKADNFIDLFAGGCAISHCAMLSGKYRNVYINDINKAPIELFFNAINGKYKDEKRWISREDFFKKKEVDPYIRYCWSFGNNGRSYLYGKNIEGLKKSMHYAILFDDYSLLEKQGIYVNHIDEKDIKKKRLYICREVKKVRSKRIGLENLERLQRLQNLQRIENLDINIKISHLSYDEFEIPKNSVVYCDPPYNNTKCGEYKGFDNNKFNNWAKSQDNIYISEYDMPSNFKKVSKISKRQCSFSKGSKAIKEGLYVPIN